MNYEVVAVSYTYIYIIYIINNKYIHNTINMFPSILHNMHCLINILYTVFGFLKFLLSGEINTGR